MAGYEVIGVIYNDRVAPAVELAEEVVRRLGMGDSVWVAPAREVERHGQEADETDLVITVGGDGTILRAVRLTAPRAIPILGINMGRLGFMTELRAQEALERLPLYLQGEGCWIEERAMLKATLTGPSASPDEGEHHALNDVVVARGAVSRLIRVKAVVQGSPLTTYRADAVVVSTATGSTGYSLSAGGPILFPLMREMVLTPVACHLGLDIPLVLPEDSVVELTLLEDGQAIFSVDGYLDRPLTPGDTVQVEASPYTARFLRSGEPTQFYATLTERLSLSNSGGRPVEDP